MCRASMGKRTKSGRGLPHSKTLSRSSKAIMIPPGFGVRQSSAAFASARVQCPTVLIAGARTDLPSFDSQWQKRVLFPFETSATTDKRKLLYRNHLKHKTTHVPV